MFEGTTINIEGALFITWGGTITIFEIGAQPVPVQIPEPFSLES